MSADEARRFVMDAIEKPYPKSKEIHIALIDTLRAEKDSNFSPEELEHAARVLAALGHPNQSVNQ